jgi:hypothetical protein
MPQLIPFLPEHLRRPQASSAAPVTTLDTSALQNLSTEELQRLEGDARSSIVERIRILTQARDDVDQVIRQLQAIVQPTVARGATEQQ